MTIKLAVAAVGSKPSGSKTRFVLWVGETGHSRKEIEKYIDIITNALEEKGLSWEITTGFECA